MNKQGRSAVALGSALIITAGVFWGSMGVFVRALSDYGFDSIQIVCLRLTVAAIVFAALSVALGRGGAWRIAARDIPLFLGLGLGSILFFTVCYFSAINMMTLSTAAILLYTSPIWVMLMSCVFFKERLTVRKVAALLCAFGGCMLVSGMGGAISVVGLLIGLCSGLGYGLYSILGSVALKKYAPLTVTAGTFVVAAAGAWCVCAPQELVGKVSACGEVGALLLLVAVTGLITAVIPFAAYTVGLKYVEPSRAAILATVEPMVATLFGAALFGESITLASAVGILLILCAIILLNAKKK